MKTAQEIIDLIKEAGAENAQSIRATLEDGAGLLALGITDEDQEAVELAHDLISHKVILNGKEIDFDAAVNLMDDEIRENLHSAVEWVSEQQFLDVYVQEHAAKYDGEEFKVE